MGGQSHKNKPSPIFIKTWKEGTSIKTHPGFRGVCRSCLVPCSLSAGGFILSCREVCVCPVGGLKYLGTVPHKWTYISSVDGRGVTGIKKSLSAPLLWQQGHERDMSGNQVALAATENGNGAVCESWCDTWIWTGLTSSQRGQTVVSVGDFTKYRKKSRAREKWIHSYYLWPAGMCVKGWKLELQCIFSYLCGVYWRWKWWRYRFKISWRLMDSLASRTFLKNSWRNLSTIFAHWIKVSMWRYNQSIKAMKTPNRVICSTSGVHSYWKSPKTGHKYAVGFIWTANSWEVNQKSKESGLVRDYFQLWMNTRLVHQFIYTAAGRCM